jgi:hypothetical protein
MNLGRTQIFRCKPLMNSKNVGLNFNTAQCLNLWVSLHIKYISLHCVYLFKKLCFQFKWFIYISGLKVGDILPMHKTKEEIYKPVIYKQVIRYLKSLKTKLE